MSLLDEKTLPKTYTYCNWGSGYSMTNEFPPPVLGNISIPLVPNAPDMAGMWEVIEVFGRLTGRKIEGGDEKEQEKEQEQEEDQETEEEHTAGWPLENPHVGFVQRIEQAGNRVVITSSAPRKVIHDMVCDGSVANGVDDVSGMDLKTHIKATAEYIHDEKHGGMHVMRPVTPRLGRITCRMQFKRWREGDKLILQYGLFTIHMRRVVDRVKNTAAGDKNACSVETSLDEQTSSLPPRVNTYPHWGCGYSNRDEFPPLSLGSINVPLVPEAPDMRGIWKIVEIFGRVMNNKISDHEEGWPLKHPPRDVLQRIEQAGNRVVITTAMETTAAGGSGSSSSVDHPPHRVIHDMICDGSIEGCADDVSGRDHVTHIRATGKFIADERGKVHVLSPIFNHVDINIPGIDVERWIEGDRLVWQYGFHKLYLERVVEGGEKEEKEEEENTEGVDASSGGAGGDDDNKLGQKRKR